MFATKAIKQKRCGDKTQVSLCLAAPRRKPKNANFFMGCCECVLVGGRAPDVALSNGESSHLTADKTQLKQSPRADASAGSICKYGECPIHELECITKKRIVL